MRTCRTYRTTIWLISNIYMYNGIALFRLYYLALRHLSMALISKNIRAIIRARDDMIYFFRVRCVELWLSIIQSCEIFLWITKAFNILANVVQKHGTEYLFINPSKIHARLNYTHTCAYVIVYTYVYIIYYNLCL